MGIRVALHHRTQYRYDRAVAFGPQVIQLRPTPHCKTPILSYSLDITPAYHTLNWQLDPHANYLARVLVLEKTQQFAVDVNLVADLSPVNPFAFFLEPGYESFPLGYNAELTRDLQPFLTAQPAGPRMQQFLQTVSRETQGIVAFLVALNQRVRDEIAYITRLEHGVQSPEETLLLRTGSCRDSAWLLVEACRHLGIASRFVSGYLIQLASEERTSGSGASRSVDSADLHAWAEVYLPGAGWIGMDPTSGLFTAEQHIPLVCTPSAAQAAPVGGTVEAAKVDFDFEMSVRRIDDIADSGRPYSEEEWARVREVAHQVDGDLRERDVRLTMGGEPTFVGIDEPESMQWNLEALGPLKRIRGLALIRRLRERTAPGGLLHFGQGKWYPGEALPRWAFHCISRVDGVPVWENPQLIASEDVQYHYASGDALKFAQALMRRLQVSAENLLVAVDPGEDAERPAGYVLPLRRPEGRLFTVLVEPTLV